MTPPRRPATPATTPEPDRHRSESSLPERPALQEGERQPTGKPPVRFYWWPLWMFLLAVSMFFFYVVLTPVWIGIRLVAWLSERSRPTGARLRTRKS